MKDTAFCWLVVKRVMSCRKRGYSAGARGPRNDRMAGNLGNAMNILRSQGGFRKAETYFIQAVQDYQSSYSSDQEWQSCEIAAACESAF